MQPQLRGLATVLIAGATAVCGFLMVGGVGPAANDAALSGDRLPLVGSATSTTIDGEVAVTSTSSTSVPTNDATTVAPSSSTTVAPQPSTTEPAVPSPVPLSVAASSTVVGVGGVVEFSGECLSVDGQPLGPVIVWTISDTTDRLDTGVTATGWTYRWTAPTNPDLIRSYTFQFWCGDPAGWQGGYPADLQRTIDMVAQIAPTSTTIPLIEVDTPSDPIPETN